MNKSRLLLIFFAGFVLLNILIIGFYLIKNSSTKKLPTSSQNPSGLLAKVGEENIYLQDVDHELENHPQKDLPGIRNKLLDKIITDSIILQGGAADGIISLDSSFFNSPEKNYAERINNVEKVKNKIESMSVNIKGSVISIWFHNNGYIGPLGLEKGKEIAYEKLSNLRNQIVDKKITIQEAGEDIKKDTSLYQIDRAWTSNAILDFSATADQKITFVKEFDEIIRNLAVNEVSEVYLADDVGPDGKKLYEALYLVAQVTEKNNTPGVTNYDSWLQNKKNTYGVQKY